MAQTPALFTSAKSDDTDPGLAQASHWNNAMTVLGRVRSRTVDVRDYGAIGDGTTDDTAAIQAAITAVLAAGGGTVCVPQPSVSYKVTSTITIQGSPTAYLNLVGYMAGFGSTIVWAGGNSTSVFHSLGWCRSTIQGVSINLGSATGVVAWDIDDSPTYATSNNLTFLSCYVNVRTGASNIGWRHGHSQGSNNSSHTWITCGVEGDTAYGVSGQVGWTWEHLNCLGFTWINCEVLSLKSAWLQRGGGSMRWFGCTGAFDAVDFDMTAEGPFLISGGRFENGKLFLSIPGGDTVCTVIGVAGMHISAYTPADGFVFLVGTAARLTIDSCRMDGATYTANLITCYTSGFGSLSVRGCSVQGANPFYNLISNGGTGIWNVHLEGNAMIASGVGASAVQNIATVGVIATASLPAAGLAQNGRIVIEDAGAGDRNLIVYAGAQRFRIDGGTAF